MEIEPEPEWHHLVPHLLKEKGVVFLLGTVDSGKSTLSRYILCEALSAGESVCLVDADVGQSSLGPPGSVSMKQFRRLSDLEGREPDHVYFLGAVNPARMPLPLIRGTLLMVKRCRKRSKIVLVDTTGLISGPIGLFLKKAKIEAVAPGHIIAIQKERELEPILEKAKGICIDMLAPSAAVKPRGPKERERYRFHRFRQYLPTEYLRQHSIETDRIECFFNGRPFVPVDEDFVPNLVVGLNRGEETLALGVITGRHASSLVIATPLADLDKIDRIVMGYIETESI